MFMSDIVGVEYFEYLYGGLVYWLSPAFREKKQREWANKSNMYKIYEVGMWVSIPLITLLLVVVVVVSK